MIELKEIDEKTGAGDGEWVISSTRPLRVYKRSSTDSVLYQKPSLMHQYKRADTVATTDIATGMDKLRMSEDREEGRLTQKHRSSSRSSLVSFGSGFFNKFKSRSRTSLQNYWWRIHHRLVQIFIFFAQNITSLPRFLRINQFTRSCSYRYSVLYINTFVFGIYHILWHPHLILHCILQGQNM